MEVLLIFRVAGDRDPWDDQVVLSRRDVRAFQEGRGEGNLDFWLLDPSDGFFTVEDEN
jgi:hypothetical protein